MERYQVIAIVAIISALVEWLLHRLSKEPEGKEGNEKTCRMWKRTLRPATDGLFRDPFRDKNAASHPKGLRRFYMLSVKPCCGITVDSSTLLTAERNGDQCQLRHRPV